MNLIDLVFYDNTDSKLNRIKEVFLTFPYKSIGIDVIRSCVGTMMLEVTRNVVKEHESNQELFDFIVVWFKLLDADSPKLKYFHLKYMIELTDHIGFSPLTNYNESNPYFDLLAGEFVEERYQGQTSLDLRLSFVLHSLLTSDLHTINLSNEISAKERDNLVDEVIRYYELHVPNFLKIKSLEILKQLMG
jgi:DNA repair protein RecO (recombination protein O)